MSRILDKLREGTRFARMRMGQEAPGYVSLLSNPEARFALVPLIESEYHLALEAVAQMNLPDNAYGGELMDRHLRLHTLRLALRDPDNPREMVFESVEQMLSEEIGLEPADVNHLLEMYQRETDFSSPALEGLTDEQVDDLKKGLLKIDWSALSGRPWWHLKQFFLTLPGGVPLDNSPSVSSMLNSIGMSDEPESIPGASES